jgi:aspartate aminotransferase
MAASMNVQQPVSLNLNIRGLGLSATLAINDKCQALQEQGRDVFRLGLGQSPFPVPDPVVRALRTSADQRTYQPVHGLQVLREAVAKYHREHEGVDVCPECVLIGPGSKELMFLLQLVYYGEILVRTPCWVSYVPQAQIIGRRISRLHTTYESRWKVSAESLLRAIQIVQDDSRPRILVLNYPDNPTGLTYSVDELKELAEVARKYQVVVLSDEIYGRLHHTDKHVSIARFYPEGTIISSGLSKWCGAGGWRLGTFAFTPELRWLMEAIAAAASETYTSVSAPIQYAAVKAFGNGPEIEGYLQHARRILSALGQRCCEVLHQAGIRVYVPQGAFYLFLDFSPLTGPLAERGIRDAATLCARLLDETGVAILPGSAFVRPRHELTARLAYVDFEGGAALEASRQTPVDEPLPDRFLSQHCARVLEGVARIAEWTQRRA